MRAVLAWLMLTFLLAAPAAADVFTVRGVEVDETAGSGSEARQQAIAVGQLIAAQRLFDRLTLEEDRATLPPVDAASAARLVSGFQVEEEAIAGSRYIGRLTVSFDPTAVRDLLESYSVPYILSSAQPAVVVPLWRDETGTWLWDDNPWFEAWSIAGTADELVPVIPPSGDLADMSAIDADRAIRLERGPLQSLATNYGSAHVLVAMATPTDTPGRISARMVGIDFAHGGQQTDYGSLGTGEPVELARAAAARLQDNWKRMLVVRDPYLSDLPVTLLYGSTAEWIALQQIVAGEPLVQVARLDAITNDGAVMTLQHRGRQDQLALVLREHGLELAETPGLGWTIRRAGAASSEAPPYGAGGAPYQPDGGPYVR